MGLDLLAKAVFTGGVLMEGVKPDKIDKHGPAWATDKVITQVANEINSPTGFFLKRISKTMQIDHDNANNITNEANQMFQKTLSELLKTTDNLQASTKKVSGSVRKAADELGRGLIKVQQQADFNNLERYVLLLERAASAMSALAELEKTGKLEKIAAAIK